MNVYVHQGNTPVEIVKIETSNFSFPEMFNKVKKLLSRFGKVKPFSL